jgi:hypothetical protein
MSNQPRQPTQPRQRMAALAFDRDEWELIVTLPRRVLMAAVAAAPADGRRAAEGIAGIEAIASGLASPSPLVREVVGSIYSESHREPPELSADGDVLTVQTLAACRYASEVVAQRCAPEDAAAYREWLTHIGAVVTGVAQGVATPVPTGRVGLAESRFLYALDGVLRP